MPFFKKIQLGGGGPYDKIKIKLIKITNGNTINYELIKKVISEALDINIENSEIDTILNNLKIYKYIDQKTFLDFIMLIEFNNKNKTTRDFLKDTIDDIQKPNNFTLKSIAKLCGKLFFAARAAHGKASNCVGFVRVRQLQQRRRQRQRWGRRLGRRRRRRRLGGEGVKS